MTATHQSSTSVGYHFSLSAFAKLAVTGFLALWLAACDSTTAEEHVANAEASLAASDISGGLIHAKNAVQQQPNLAAARAVLGRLQFEAGEFGDGQKELERAIDLGDDSIESHTALIKALSLATDVTENRAAFRKFAGVIRNRC